MENVHIDILVQNLIKIKSNYSYQSSIISKTFVYFITNNFIHK
jgi:hypothetical protein